MQQFIAKFRDQITGVISGFDRLIFRGVLRRLVYSRGMEQYLWQNQDSFQGLRLSCEEGQPAHQERVAGTVSRTACTRGVPALTQNDEFLVSCRSNRGRATSGVFGTAQPNAAVLPLAAKPRSLNSCCMSICSRS